tara:strand:+ start:381 stop:563 length:183 start_codon:yes stop_codon:yes gene_type:complete
VREMCLALEGKIVELKREGKVAVVKFNDGKRALPNLAEAKVGEKVLVQQGFVVDVLEGLD